MMNGECMTWLPPASYIPMKSPRDRYTQIRENDNETQKGNDEQDDANVNKVRVVPKRIPSRRTASNTKPLLFSFTFNHIFRSEFMVHSKCFCKNCKGDSIEYSIKCSCSGSWTSV